MTHPRRAAVLNAVIGLRWEANARGPLAFDCYHLFVYAQQALGGRCLAPVEVPQSPSWAWMIAAIEGHPERARWREVPAGAMNLVRASDLAAVLMARTSRPAHIGTWCADEGRILHADPDCGVCFDTPADLRSKGWARLRFFEPVE